MRTFPERPKNMHKKTYNDIVAQAIDLERSIVDTMVAQLTPDMKASLDTIRKKREEGVVQYLHRRTG